MLIFDQLKKDDPHLRVITWWVLAGMVTLLGGLWYVQVVSHKHFAQNQKNQSFRTVRIPAIRGKILDREGQPVAENQPSYNLGLYLEELRPLFKAGWRESRPKGKLSRQQRLELEAEVRYTVVSNVVQTVAGTLQLPVAVEPQKFHRHYTNQLALPLPLLSITGAVQLARYHEQSSNPPGVDLEVQPYRFYPRKSTAAHVVGFLVSDNSSSGQEDAFFNFRLPDYRGLLGIEGVFDQELRGKAGVKSVLVNNLGYRQSETIWTPAEPGHNVILTLDLDLQQAAEKALQSVSAGVRGAVVAMDPNTGDLLAVCSLPTFDPNVFVPRISHADYQRLMDENLKPQRNRATQENYAPGSIFKIISGLACLEAGLDPGEKMLNPPSPTRVGRGHIQIGKRIIQDTASHGEYDFKRAFIKSSNTYFISNVLRYDALESVIRLGQRLQLGQKAGLPTRQDSPGMFPTYRRTRSDWFIGDTANLAIGQGQIAVTPLQMAVMTAAIANGGKVLWPRLVARIEPQDPTIGQSTTIFPQGRVRAELGVSPRSLRIIREAMLADVEDQEEGSGKLAAVPGLRIGGKTGTAEVTEGTRVVDHIVWFVSYAPIEQPKYVVVVMVESGASGATTCAPVARRIYEAILQKRMRGPDLTVVSAQAGGHAR